MDGASRLTGRKGPLSEVHASRYIIIYVTNIKNGIFVFGFVCLQWSEVYYARDLLVSLLIYY